jgi:hypothetical protein
MARRSILVAIVAAAAALVPASAQAVTAPSGLSATPNGTAPPVALSWLTPLDAVTQEVFHVAGGCPGSAPVAGAAQFANPPVPLGGGTSVATDSPADGTWCYYVATDDPLTLPPTAYSNLAQVTVDQPSTGTVAVSGQVNGNFIRGTVDVTGTQADAGSGVQASALLAGTGDCATNGVPVGAAWTPVDGVYNVCNVVTDGVGNVTLVQTTQVVADSTAPTGSVLAPSAGWLFPVRVFQVTVVLLAGLLAGMLPLPQPLIPFAERCQRTSRTPEVASAASVVKTTAVPPTISPAAGASTDPVGAVLSATTWVVCTTVTLPAPSVTTLQTL